MPAQECEDLPVQYVRAPHCWELGMDDGGGGAIAHMVRIKQNDCMVLTGEQYRSNLLRERERESHAGGHCFIGLVLSKYYNVKRCTFDVVLTYYRYI